MGGIIEEAALNIILLLLALWLGTLSFVWMRHLGEDEKSKAALERRVEDQEDRLERALERVTKAIESMRDYQTAFNLETKANLSAIKSALERNR